MVDSIGTTPLTGGDRGVTRIAATTPATAIQTPLQQQALAQPQAEAKPSATSSISIARAMAAAAPINESRVAEIKKAIANGTFPILPATIADRLLALKLEWTSNDKA